MCPTDSMLARSERIQKVVKALGLAQTVAGNMVSRPWSTTSQQSDVLSYITHVHSAREVTRTGKLPALPSPEPMELSYGGLSFPSPVLVVILQGSHPTKFPGHHAYLQSSSFCTSQPSFTPVVSQTGRCLFWVLSALAF